MHTTTPKGGRPVAIRRRTVLIAFTITPAARKALHAVRGPFTEGDAIEVLIRQYARVDARRMPSRPIIKDEREVCVVRLTPRAVAILRRAAKFGQRSQIVEWLIRDRATPDLQEIIRATATKHNRSDRRSDPRVEPHDRASDA